MTYAVKPGNMDVFLDLLWEQVSETKAAESGCLQFDILRPDAEERALQLHKVCADEVAFRAHNSSAQLATYKVYSEPPMSDHAVIWRTVEK